MVEENGTSGGNGDPLAQSPHPIAVTAVREATIVTYTTPNQKVLQDWVRNIFYSFISLISWVSLIYKCS